MVSVDSTAQPGLPSCWLVLAGCAAGSAYFWTQDDRVTAVSLLAVAIAGLCGYRVGALRLVACFGGLFLAVRQVPLWAEPWIPYLAEYWGASAWNRWLAIGACSLGVFLAALWAARLLAWLLFPERPWLQGWNRWLGFSCGAAQGMGLILLLLGGLLVVERELDRSVYSTPGSPTVHQLVAEHAVKIAQQTRHSMIGPWVVAANPFDHVPQLRGLIHDWHDPTFRQRYRQEAWQRLATGRSL